MRLKVKSPAAFYIFLLVFLATPSFTAAESLKAPSFSSKDLQGQVQSPEKYLGKPLVIYFWATWCPACRQEVENMVDLYHRFHPKGVEFISVSLDQDLARLRNFVQEKGIPYPVLFDGLGWENTVARLYEVEATPTFYLIDPHGIVEKSGSWSSDLVEIFRKYT